jgi:hypothetical protein
LLTLAGVSLLFACLQANGAMEAAAQRALRLCRGRVALLPLVFFGLAALLAMVGPGAILSVALMAPLAMRTGVPAGIPAFLISLMIGNGANAGNLSPFSSIGVIVHGLLTRGGLGGHELRVWFFPRGGAFRRGPGRVSALRRAAAFLEVGGRRNRRAGAAQPSADRSLWERWWRGCWR